MGGFLPHSPAMPPWERLLFALPFAIALITQVIAIARGTDEAALERLEERSFGVISMLAFLVMFVFLFIRGDGLLSGASLLAALIFAYRLFFTKSPG